MKCAGAGAGVGLDAGVVDEGELAGGVSVYVAEA
jgi:hypothetical protein